MDYARLTTALLKDVDETYYYGASCGACHHASRLSLVKLREYLGDDFPVIEIRFVSDANFAARAGRSFHFLRQGTVRQI